MKKKQAKEHTQVFGQFQSIKAFEHFNVRFKHSKIWTSQYLNTCYNAHNESELKMAQCLFICDIDLSIEEDLPMFLIKEYDLKTQIKGYHAYMMKWTPKNWEILKARPEPGNEYDKYAVAVEGCGSTAF